MTTPRIPLIPGVPSDKLVKPLNAPAAGNAAAGVQPGVSNAIILAQYVVVFGTTGGVFIYAGTPGPGNPPIYSMANADADPYGNVIEPGIWAGTTAGPQVGIQVSSNAGVILFPFPGTFAADARAGSIEFSSGAALELIGPQDMAPANDLVSMLLTDNTAGGGLSAEWFLIYQDANGHQNTHAVGSYLGVTLPVVAALTAVTPGTGTSNTNPATSESWHTVSLDAGWSSAETLRYKLLAESSTVWVQGAVTHAGFSGTVNINGSTPIPAAYRPSTNHNIGGPGIPGRAGGLITSAGVFVAEPGSATCTECDINGIYPLN